jgi:cytochrome c oxidase subunit IV
MSESTLSNVPADAHGHDGHDDHDWGAHVRTYMKVGAILFIGTLLTVFAAYQIDLRHRASNITLGLLIATVKSSLVALIFMHLKNEKTMIYKFLFFTVIFFALMLFLILSSQSDPLPADATNNMVFKK